MIDRALRPRPPHREIRDPAERDCKEPHGPDSKAMNERDGRRYGFHYLPHIARNMPAAEIDLQWGIANGRWVAMAAQ
jgi:hypothetical protein